MELVNELIEELELAEDAVVAAAPDAIHANEVVLTLGLSTTTLRFLLKAAEKRSFQARCGSRRCCATLVLAFALQPPVPQRYSNLCNQHMR